LDHAINSLQPYLEAAIDVLRDEMATGRYKKLSDCPYYVDAKALVDAINILKKACYGKKNYPQYRTLPVGELVGSC